MIIIYFGYFSLDTNDYLNKHLTTCILKIINKIPVVHLIQNQKLSIKNILCVLDLFCNSNLAKIQYKAFLTCPSNFFFQYTNKRPIFKTYLSWRRRDRGFPAVCDRWSHRPRLVQATCHTGRSTSTLGGSGPSPPPVGGNTHYCQLQQHNADGIAFLSLYSEWGFSDGDRKEPYC